MSCILHCFEALLLHTGEFKTPCGLQVMGWSRLRESRLGGGGGGHTARHPPPQRLPFRFSLTPPTPPLLYLISVPWGGVLRWMGPPTNGRARLQMGAGGRVAEGPRIATRDSEGECAVRDTPVPPCLMGATPPHPPQTHPSRLMDPMSCCWRHRQKGGHIPFPSSPYAAPVSCMCPPPREGPTAGATHP